MLPALMLWWAVLGLLLVVRLSWMALSLLWYGLVSLARWTLAGEESDGEV
jgi:hypothetical protein